MGTERVREIACDKWQTTYVENNVVMNFTITWYFAAPQWNVYGNPLHVVPIRAIFSGAVSNAVFHQDNFEYLVDFSQFYSGEGAVVPAVFAVPKHCLVALAPIPLPTIPTTFYTLSQISFPLLKFSMTFQEWYDSTTDRAKFEIHSGGYRNLTMVLGQSRTILTRSTFQNSIVCNSFQVDNTSRFIDQQGHIRSIDNLLHFGAQYGVRYNGREWVRGIHCDHWFTNFTGTLNGLQNHFWTHEIYFTAPGWINGGSPQQIPVRTITTGYPIGAGGRPSHIPDYQRTIDYLGFYTGKFLEYEWNPPTGCPGHSAYADVNQYGVGHDLAPGTYAGIGVSFSILGLISGLGAGALFGFYAAKSLRPVGNL